MREVGGPAHHSAPARDGEGDTRARVAGQAAGQQLHAHRLGAGPGEEVARRVGEGDAGDETLAGHAAVSGAGLPEVAAREAHRAAAAADRAAAAADGAAAAADGAAAADADAAAAADRAAAADADATAAAAAAADRAAAAADRAASAADRAAAADADAAAAADRAASAADRAASAADRAASAADRAASAADRTASAADRTASAADRAAAALAAAGRHDTEVVFTVRGERAVRVALTPRRRVAVAPAERERGNHHGPPGELAHLVESPLGRARLAVYPKSPTAPKARPRFAGQTPPRAAPCRGPPPPARHRPSRRAP